MKAFRYFNLTVVSVDHLNILHNIKYLFRVHFNSLGLGPLIHSLRLN